MSDLSDLLRLAQGAADAARAEILRHWRSSLQVEFKADNTPVTVADRNAEETIRAYLRGRDSGFGFVGEEFGREKGKNGVVWVMDPIDGTKSFVRRVPLFGTLLACFRDGRPVVGLIDLPALGRRVWASAGAGAFVDGEPARVSSVDDPAKGCLLSGTVNTFETAGLGEEFHSLRRQFGLYRGWGDCFGYFQVACGQAEAMVDPVVSIWDVAPFAVLFQEAGGRFSDLKGSLRMLETVDSDAPLSSDDCTAVATNGLLHDRVLEAFAGGNPPKTC